MAALAGAATLIARLPLMLGPMESGKLDGYCASKIVDATSPLPDEDAAGRWGAQHGVRAFSVHPGSIVATDLGKYASPDLLRAMKLIGENGEPVINPYAGKKTVAQGASSSVWCTTRAATAPPRCHQRGFRPTRSIPLRRPGCGT